MMTPLYCCEFFGIIFLSTPEITVCLEILTNFIYFQRNSNYNVFCVCFWVLIKPTAKYFDPPKHGRLNLNKKKYSGFLGPVRSIAVQLIADRLIAGSIHRKVDSSQGRFIMGRSRFLVDHLIAGSIHRKVDSSHAGSIHHA
jgi:hypothetical protein